MLHVVVTVIAVIVFSAAAIANLLGRPSTKADYVRWGYPSWWGHVTGGLEIVAAVLIAAPVTRASGLILGAVIIVAAIATVVRRRELNHLPPLGVFVAISAAAALTRPWPSRDICLHKRSLQHEATAEGMSANHPC